ncbi:hypothetical protein [Nocardia sp. CC201C]|uniref:hypothetical protein n=1 Tax=Nocardia sp. CC201C TaxID=3044575 RepID=UPI0024A8BB2B|nr:hypothetical protein [Nocardia sp. CC201C]
MLDTDLHQRTGVLLPPGVTRQHQQCRGAQPGSGGEVQRFPRGRHDRRIGLAHQLVGVRDEQVCPHLGGEIGAREQTIEAVDDRTVDRAVGAGLPRGGLGPGGERGDHQIVAPERFGVLHGLLPGVPGRGEGPGPDLCAEQPAEQVDALVRVGGVGDGVGEESGGDIVGIPRLGQFGGPHAIADGLRRSRTHVVMGQGRDVAAARQGRSDPGVHSGGPQPAHIGQ